MGRCGHRPLRVETIVQGHKGKRECRKRHSLLLFAGCPAACGAALGRRDAGIILSGEKCVHREIDLAEHLAGIFVRRAGDVRAAFARDAVIEARDEQLCAALEPRDGELADGYKQALALAAEHELFFEAVENSLRNLGGVARAAVAGADLLYARAKNHRVDDLDDGLGDARFL